MTSLATAFVTIRPDTSGFGVRLAKSVSSDADKAGTTAGKRFGSKFAGMAKVGALALGGGAALGAAAFIKGSVGVEAQFSKTMNVLQATTQAPKKDMADLSRLAMKMGADTVFSANDASKAMLELARGGMNAATIRGGALQGTLTLAAAGELEMGEAANVAVKAMGQFNLKGKDMDSVAAAIAGGANASSASVRDMSVALSQGGLAANSVGFSLQETTGILAAFSNAGLEGSDAGTSLKTTLDRLQPTTNAQKAAMMGLGAWSEKTGSAFVKSNGQFKSAAQIAEILRKGTENLDAAERKRLITQAFGSDAQRGATILAQEGAAGLNKMLKATSDTGAAQKMAAANMKGTSGAIERLKGSVETAQLAMGQALAPAIQKVANYLSERIIPAVTKFIVGMSQGTGAGGRFAAVLGGLKDVVVAVFGFIARNKEAVGAFAGIILTVVAAVRVWTAVQTLLNIVLTANPLGLVVVAIAGFAAGLVYAYKKSETFRKIVDGAFHGVQVAVSAVWNWVKKNWPYLLGILTGPIGLATVFIIRHWDTIKSKTKAAWQAMKDIVRLAGLRIVDGVAGMAEKIIGVFAKLPGKMGAPFRTALAKVREFRAGVNAEMDRINDEDVRISLTTIRSATAKNAATLGDRVNRGGKGPIPGAAMRGAMGGVGIIPRVSGNMAGARSAANSTAQTRHEIAMQAAEAIQDKLEVAHKKAVAAASAGALGKAGPGGRVLPRGSYRIGMPYHGYPGHNGADYPAAIGTPVYSPYAGRVTASYDLPGSNPYNSTPYRSYGRVVKLAFNNGMSMLFAHLSSRIGRTGPIAAGTMVGRVGMNGNATGPHLHAEVNGGSVNPASTGLFDRGGILRHGGAAVNLSRKPERILDPRTTRNFERLTYAMDSVASRSGGSSGGAQRIEIDFGGGRTLTGWIREEIGGARAHSATIGRQHR